MVHGHLSRPLYRPPEGAAPDPAVRAGERNAILSFGSSVHAVRFQFLLPSFSQSSALLSSYFLHTSHTRCPVGSSQSLLGFQMCQQHFPQSCSVFPRSTSGLPEIPTSFLTTFLVFPNRNTPNANLNLSQASLRAAGFSAPPHRERRATDFSQPRVNSPSKDGSNAH